MKLVLTCEHGGNVIPEGFKVYFEKQEALLNSHRGYDLGALDLFHHLNPLAGYTLHSETSRLLIELNRSLHHPKLFSEFTKSLLKAEKEQLINTYYLPYRVAVENTIRGWINQSETVLHVSVHSFTPNLNGIERNCDIGLLFDSRRNGEKAFCKFFKEDILSKDPNLKIRYNYPYLGKADGFTTHLRKQFQNNYLGIELEVNQKYAIKNIFPEELKLILFSAIKSVLQSHF
ncbi:N-formylglutamate amidohydrolase [Flavobacteriaceae bacterium SZ-1-7]|uniref:N-formylglutamate amidohydrolase n=1 Tax=Tamlana sedimenti TaxID=3134126 RepID=UPI003126593B